MLNRRGFAQIDSRAREAVRIPGGLVACAAGEFASFESMERELPV
jgi:hypothetical protein